MAPWSFLSGSGSEAEAELPAHMEADADKSRTAFSIFIDGALTNIYNEASGRAKDQKALRASLKTVIGEDKDFCTRLTVNAIVRAEDLAYPPEQTYLSLTSGLHAYGLYLRHVHPPAMRHKYRCMDQQGSLR